MQKRPKISVIIPSLQRSEELRKVTTSLKYQSEKDFEVIIETEKGPLAKIRNKAARRARGRLLVFIDDDTWLPSTWLQGISQPFRDRSLGGVSGPAIIKSMFRKNRDIFRYRWAKGIYDFLFLGRDSHLPGHITSSGAWTTGACMETCDYEGEVDFLEACNMAFRQSAFNEVGGFDERYQGCGDWSEPDLAYRLKSKGWKLWFTQNARMFHYPSPTGPYKAMAGQSGARLKNYLLFAKRWVKPHPKHTLYKLFIRSYYAWKSLSAI